MLGTLSALLFGHVPPAMAGRAEVQIDEAADAVSFLASDNPQVEAVQHTLVDAWGSSPNPTRSP
jgi:hypothetical protein